jgi:hypothetical protein
MSKDLAVCIHGDKVADKDYLSTESFINAVKETLDGGN